MRVVVTVLMCSAVLACIDVAGETLTVPGDYASIQAAIDAAAPGDVVEVAAGVYEETLTFKAAIELRGAGAETTIVRAPSRRGELLEVIDTTGGIISGFKFEHSDASTLNPTRIVWPDAVGIKNSSVEIRKCIIGPSAGCGIIVHEKSISRIVECRLEDNSQAGIFVRNEGTTATLLRNTCINNEWGGISLTKGSNAVVEENTFFNNGKWGVKALGKGTSITLKNNAVSGNRGSGIMIEQWATGVVEGNTCRENDGYGIIFKLGANGTAIGNTADKNVWSGIVAQSLAVNVEIQDNTANDNARNGIVVCWGAQGNVTGNTCNGNSWCGIVVANWFTNAVVKENECNENTRQGLLFCSGSAGSALENVCRKNEKGGILVKDENTDADISQNMCEDNGEENIAHEAGDPLSRQDQIDSEEAGCLLAAEHFKEIEEIAGWLRQYKCRYSGGAWQLDFFYKGLQKGCGDISPKHREDFTALLERWKNAYPQSVTPLITQAIMHTDYGWEARGGGYADSVTNKGWKTFKEELAIARDYLLEAEKLNGNDPHLYRQLLYVCKGLGYETDQLHEMFEKGIEIDLGYFPVYNIKAWSLTHRWGGRPGELERFAEKVFDRTQKEYGHTMYALIAGSTVGFLGDKAFADEHSFDWVKIDKGYIELTTEFPKSNYYLNQHCLMACIHGDQKKAKILFDKVERDVDESVWRGREGFRKWKIWALDSGTGSSVTADNMPGEAALLFSEISWIRVAVVFALLVVLIVFVFLRAKSKKQQSPSLPEPDPADAHKDHDEADMEQ